MKSVRLAEQPPPDFAAGARIWDLHSENSACPWADGTLSFLFDSVKDSREIRIALFERAGLNDAVNRPSIFMSHSNVPESADFERSFLNSGSLAFLLLRLWLGMRTFMTGIEKFSGTKVTQEPLLDEFGDPDISGAMVDVKTKVYGFSHYHGLPEPLYNKFQSEPLLPNWALAIYGGTLGYLLILLGALLIVGALPRISLFLTGLLYISLTFGLVLLNESGGVAWLGIHLGLIAYALTLVKHNTFSAFNKY